MQLRARAYARTKASLFKVIQHLSDVRWRDLLRKPRWCVHCRRKAVITMLNERFVALYSDDTSLVTGCDGCLANIFRSRRTVSSASDLARCTGRIWELSVIWCTLDRRASTESCDYVNVLLRELLYLQLHRWIIERTISRRRCFILYNSQDGFS